MNYVLEDNGYTYTIRLTDAAKSLNDLMGKTIDNIAIVFGDIVIRFEDKSCAIFDPEHGANFRDCFDSSDLHNYGFLLDPKDVAQIKIIRDEKDKKINMKNKQKQLIRLESQIKALQDELANN